MGISYLLISVVSCIDLNRAVTEAYGEEKAKKLAVSAMFSILVNLGATIGAVYSQTFFDAYGFRVVNELMGSYIVLDMLFYMVMNRINSKKKEVREKVGEE